MNHKVNNGGLFQDRFWHKNRGIHGDCIGVDLNNNFMTHHCEFGSRDPCSRNYCGPKHFSEPETSAIRDAVKKMENLMFAWTFLSSGSMWLYPYGYDDEKHPPHLKSMVNLYKKKPF